ncbi:MAG: trimethylamine methyltransferase family protein, partial [Tabrizicola sp.]|nr:trimethylamine methyltransferase family protein [Tabrizicola sp.]
MTEDAPRRKRAGGRAGMQTRAGTAVIDQMPWRIPVNPDRPVEPLDADGVQRVHKTAMRILSDIGIEFLNPEAVEILKKAGCIVNGTNVRMDEAFVMEMVGHAPETFTITPRNPAREIVLGGNHMVFVNVSSPPNAWDMERGKRSGDFETFKEFMKLTQYFNCIHVA